MDLNCSPPSTHIRSFPLDTVHKMRKRKSDPWITMAIILSPTSLLERTTKGLGATGRLGHHYMPHSKNAPDFSGGENLSINQTILYFISVPYSVYTMASSLYISHLALCCLLSLLLSSVLFSVWQLSGPTWPGLISVSYGSWRVRPSPLNTDWLAGLISSLRTRCSLPASALLSELGQTEKNVAREQIWTHTNTRTLGAGTYTSTERLYFKMKIHNTSVSHSSDAENPH